MLDAPQLDAQALAKLNLNNQPFLPPERCEDYFVNTALGMLINGVYQQLANHEGVQVIKGELGIGKTSFCHRLLCDVPDGFSIDLHRAESGQTINAFLRTLAGLDEADANAGTQELAVQAANRVFRHLFDQRQPVLLVDDAHLLAAKTLQTLFKFLNAIAKQNYGRLKLILVGERKVDEMLAKVDPSLLKPDEIFNTLLRPLTRPDIEHYIRFRLERAGATQPMPLTAKELAAVQSGCGGLPGKINRLACETLNGRNGNIGAKKPVGKLFLSIALPALILAPLVFWLTANRTADSPAASTHSTANTNNNQSKEKQAKDPPVVNEGSGGVDETETAILNTSNSDTGDAIERISNPDALPVISAGSEPAPAHATDNIIDPASSASWLAAQPESYYMIQLAGTWNLETLRAFSRHLNLDKTLVFHQSLRNGQTWYVLLYGPFPDYDLAHHAISELPQEVQSYNPWVRPVAALKKSH
jgi:type II secretory pathway predicted ATPase ExeA